jgi:hypothetical protein
MTLERHAPDQRAARRPTLSVLMSNYNHARFLRDALNGVLAQTYRPLEVIIIDDASTDDSVEIIEHYVRKDRIFRFVRNETNLGILSNMGTLVELARGDYVVGCACDDVLLPHFFERSMSLLTAYPQAGLCSTLTRIMDEDGTDRGVLTAPIDVDKPTYLPPDMVRRILTRSGSWLQGNTITYRRDALIEAGGFRRELLSLTDSFAAQVLALAHGACFLPEPLAIWRQTQRGYARRVGEDPAVASGMVAAAHLLMRTEFRDVFPVAYIQRWLADQRYQQDRAQAQKWREAELTRLSAQTDCQGYAMSDRIERGIRRAAVEVTWALRVVRALASHRPVHAVRRALRRVRKRAIEPGRLGGSRASRARGGSTNQRHQVGPAEAG